MIIWAPSRININTTINRIANWKSVTIKRGQVSSVVHVPTQRNRMTTDGNSHQNAYMSENTTIRFNNLIALDQINYCYTIIGSFEFNIYTYELDSDQDFRWLV